MAWNLSEIDSSPNHRDFYKKKPWQAKFAWMSPTSHACTGLKLKEMLIYMLEIPLMNTKKQIQAENEVYEESFGTARHF